MVDAVSNAKEVDTIKDIAQRGVAVIAAAHGTTPTALFGKPSAEQLGWRQAEDGSWRQCCKVCTTSSGIWSVFVSCNAPCRFCTACKPECWMQVIRWQNGQAGKVRSTSFLAGGRGGAS